MRRGYTLVEVMVAGGLLALLTTLCIHIWLSMSRMWSHGSVQATLQQGCLVLTRRVEKDLQVTKPGSFRLDNAAAPGWTLSFLASNSPASYSSTGDQNWSKWIQYRYSPTAQTLQRGEVALTPASANPNLNAIPAWPPLYVGTIGQSLTACNASIVNGCLHMDVLFQLNTNSCATRLWFFPGIYGLDSSS